MGYISRFPFCHPTVAPTSLAPRSLFASDGVPRYLDFHRDSRPLWSPCPTIKPGPTSLFYLPVGHGHEQRDTDTVSAKAFARQLRNVPAASRQVRQDEAGLQYLQKGRRWLRGLHRRRAMGSAIGARRSTLQRWHRRVCFSLRPAIETTPLHR